MAGKIFPTDEEKELLEREIRGMIASSGSNISDTVRRFNARYGTSDTPQTFLRQVKNGTIPVWKLRRIADILGWEVKIERKKNKKAAIK